MIKKIIIVFFLSTLLFSFCNKKAFSLHLIEPIPLSSVLSDLAHKCNFSVVFDDEKSKNLIKKKISFVNVENVSLKKLLDILFKSANLFYEKKDSILHVRYFDTKTFKINYIPSTITGTTKISSDTNNINSNYDFNFWEGVKENIEQILKNISSNYKKPIIDKNAGLVTVTGNRIQIDEIKKYIEQLNKTLHKEVLIDVRIYSVTLSKSHTTGINWSKLQIEMPDSSTPLRANNIFGSNSIFDRATFSIAGLLNFLAQNGTVNAISNPKIVTLNNQKAIINVGENIHYRYVSDIVYDKNGNPIKKYEIDSKFVGVLLDITPQISEDGMIILRINPKISSFLDKDQLKNTINLEVPPNTKENSLMSVVRLKDNQVLVLGGLITTDKSLQVNGVPVLKEIPIIKYLFSSKEEISTKKELVFVITPHIIDLNKMKTLSDYGYKNLPSLEDLDVK